MSRLALMGLAAGGALALLIALGDRLRYGPNGFGPATLFIGMVAGGLSLLAGLSMSMLSYWLARRGQAPATRRRLLSTAVFCGAAGLTLSLACTGVWAAAGAPLFP